MGAAFIALMVARGGEAIVFLQRVSQGNRTRATIKALPTTFHPPSPLRMNQRHFVRLMQIGDPLRSSWGEATLQLALG